MKTKNIRSKVGQFYNWYIKGEYHCDHCPYCWEEWSYEGDGDCGCYIKGDIQDTCRLLPPFKNIIGTIRKKKADYYLAHSWDGFGEFCQKQNEKEMFLREKLQENIFKKRPLYEQNSDGAFVLVDDYTQEYSYIRPTAAVILNDYEERFFPVVHKSLKEEWEELVKKTLNKVFSKFKPYFCK